MVMTLLAPASGKIFYQALEGSALASGDMIARLELDNPEAAQQVVEHKGGFPELGPPLVYSSKVHQKFKTAFTAAKNVLQGGLEANSVHACLAEVHLISSSASGTHAELKCQYCILIH